MPDNTAALPRANAIVPVRRKRRRRGWIVGGSTAIGLVAVCGAVVGFAAQADPMGPRDFAAMVVAGADPAAGAAAETAIAAANDALGVAVPAVDTSALDARIAALDDYQRLPATEVIDLADAAETEASDVIAATDAWTTAEAKRVADEQAAAAAAAEAQAAANTVEGAQATARQLAADQYGWGDDQFSCLVALWNKESGWSYTAENASSGAYGIPQALPGSKMSTVAEDWATNATTQITWGLQYIASGYGTPCSAWSHSESTGWY